MKKIFLITFSILSLILLYGCNNKSSWQGAHYKWPAETDIEYWPIFTNYEGCKNWAISKKSEAYNNYIFCSKNCHDSIDGTPICEEVVRSWAPFERSMTFDNYIE